jgi:hypothetical protein
MKPTIYCWDEISEDGAEVNPRIWDLVSPDAEAQAISDAIDRLHLGKPVDDNTRWGTVSADFTYLGYRVITTRSSRGHESIILIINE